MRIGAMSAAARALRPPRRAAATADRAAASGAVSLRTGVERAMVATLAVAGPLLVLQSMPEFVAERAPGSPLVPVSLLLVLLPGLVVPFALLRAPSRPPAGGLLLLSAAAYLGLVVLERFESRSALPTAVVPWLAGLGCIAFSCLAIGMPHPLHAGVGCAALIAGITAVDLGRAGEAHGVLDTVGLAALAAGLIAGVGASRHRADRADAAQRAAQARFDGSRRQIALEEERIRTDALLHDSVLTTLLIAAAGLDSGERAVLMARNALEVVSTTQDRPADRASTQTFGRAVAALAREIAPMHGLVQLDLSAASGIELPSGVADTLVSAMLQALSNSVKHAGPAATRSAAAEPLGDGGVRLSISDDGRGFDAQRIAPERLGVRVSIVERMRLIGGRAEIRSALGSGTTVVLEWQPEADEALAERRAAVLA